MKKMKDWLKPLAIVVSLSAGAAFASPHFQADRTVFDGNDGSINPVLNFTTAESGDLYLATSVGGQMLFLSADGGLSGEAVPFMAGQTFEGEIVLPSFDTAGITAGRYPLYQVLVIAGGDVYNFNDWVGGFSALNQLYFTVGMPAEVSLDRDGDGWADDDLNHDGYHDDDQDRDGYHDGDQNRDGYHDDDTNHDGYHDDDANHDGYHDDDTNHDGYHDDDTDHDGYHDDDANHDGFHDGGMSSDDGGMGPENGGMDSETGGTDSESGDSEGDGTDSEGDGNESDNDSGDR